jgi:hypothetical protein
MLDKSTVAYHNENITKRNVYFIFWRLSLITFFPTLYMDFGAESTRSTETAYRKTLEDVYTLGIFIVVVEGGLLLKPLND